MNLLRILVFWIQKNFASFTWDKIINTFVSLGVLESTTGLLGEVAKREKTIWDDFCMTNCSASDRFTLQAGGCTWLQRSICSEFSPLAGGGGSPRVVLSPSSSPSVAGIEKRKICDIITWEKKINLEDLGGMGFCVSQFFYLRLALSSFSLWRENILELPGASWVF